MYLLWKCLFMNHSGQELSFNLGRMYVEFGSDIGSRIIITVLLGVVCSLIPDTQIHLPRSLPKNVCSPNEKKNQLIMH